MTAETSAKRRTSEANRLSHPPPFEFFSRARCPATPVRGQTLKSRFELGQRSWLTKSRLAGCKIAENEMQRSATQFSLA
jgi:hypothetical protein